MKKILEISPFVTIALILGGIVYTGLNFKSEQPQQTKLVATIPVTQTQVDDSVVLGDGNINTIDQFTSTTSPSLAITQRIYGKALRLTGLESKACLGTDANGIVGLGTCSGGGGGSSAYEIATTSNISAPGFAYFTKTSGMTTLGSISTSTLSQYLFPNTSYGASTSTIINFTNGLISLSSTTINGLKLTDLSQGFTYVGSFGKVNTIASSSINLSWFNNDSGFITSAVASPYEIATTSTVAVPQVAYFTKTGGRTTLGGVATGTVTCTGVVGCTSFTGLGGNSAISLAGTITADMMLYVDHGGSNLKSVATSSLATNGTSITNTGTMGALVGGSSAVISLNLANPNTWTVNQTFNYSSSTIYSSFVTSSSTFAKIGTLTLSGISDGCLNITSGVVGGTGVACGSGSSLAWPWTSATNFNQNTQSTTTAAWFKGSPISLMASSTAWFDTISVASTTATSTIANFGGQRDASLYSGSDICAKVNNAYSVAKDRSVNILIPAGDYNCATAISINTANKHVWLHGRGDAVTKITYTGQATSTVIDTGQDGYASRISDLTIMGTSTTDTAPGIELGGANGFAYSQMENVNISNFGKNLTIGNNVYITKFQNVVSNFARYSALAFEYDTNSGENLTFDHFLGADNNQPSGSAYANCVALKPSTSIGIASVFFSNSSFDKCQIVVGSEVNVFGINNHIEILGNTSTSYVPIVISGDVNNTFSWVNTRFTNGNDVSHSPSSWITKTDGDLKLSGVTINDYGGYTIPYFISNTGAGAREYSGISRLSGTGFTTFELNSDTGSTMSLFGNGNLTLGTTTVNDSNTLLSVFGPTWDGSDYYQGFIGDKLYRGLSVGYDNTNNWVALHPVQPGVTSLDMFFGSPYALTSGLFLKASNGYAGLGTTSPSARLAVNPVAGDTMALAIGSSTKSLFSIDTNAVFRMGTTTAGCLNVNTVGLIYSATCSAGGGVTSVVAGAGFLNRGLNITTSGTLTVGIATSSNPTVSGLAMWSGAGDASNPATLTSISTSTLVNWILPFTSYGASTSTILGLKGGFFSTASSTLSGDVFLPALSQGVLYTGTNGIVKTVATTTTTCTNQFARTVSAFGVATCATVANTDLANSNITINGASVSLGGSITVASTTLLSDLNNWTKLQTFANATSTLFSTSYASTTDAYFGTGQGIAYIGSGGRLRATATSTFSLSQFTNDLANLTATNGTLTFSGSYNGGSAQTVGLNLANSNTWTALQNFNYSSSTVYSSFLTASSTNWTGGGLGTCSGSNFLQYTAAGFFTCGTPAGSGTVTSVVAGAGFQNQGLNITSSGTLVGAIATATTPVIGNLAYWSQTGDATNPAKLHTVATTTLTASAPLSLSQPISVIGGSASALSCTPASAGVTGCLTGTNWSTFNSKLSSYDPFSHPYAGYSATTSMMAVGTSTGYLLGAFTSASSTGPQLALSAGGGLSQWVFRNTGSSLLIATTTVAGSATSTVSALSIDQNGTTTVQNLHMNGTLLDANGNPALGLTATPGAVNYMTIANAASGDVNFSVGGGGNSGILMTTAGFSSFGVKCGSDTVNCFKVTKTSLAVVINVDTSNSRFGIATDTPWRTLDVLGTFGWSGGTTAATANNVVCINTTTKEVVQDTSPATPCSSSLRAYKYNINPNPLGLDAILQLKPVTFTWKPEYATGNFKDNGQPNDSGFVAEDVESVSTLFADYDDKGKLSSIKPTAILSATVNAVQELNRKIDNLPQYKDLQDHWQWFAMAIMLIWIIRLEIKSRQTGLTTGRVGE